MATLRLPENNKDVHLVYKYTKAESVVRAEKADALSLEVSPCRVDG